MPHLTPDLATFTKALSELIARIRGQDVEYLPVSDDVHLVHVGQAICMATFRGRGGSSEFRILTAAWRIAVEAATAVPTLPLRRLTSEAGIGSRGTTAKALSRLVDAGWLSKIGHTDGLRGNEYLLCIPNEFEVEAEVRKPGPIARAIGRPRDSNAHGAGTAGELLEDSWLMKHDAFAYKALGPSAARLYLYLLAGPCTRLELEDLTGMHRDTVKRNLQRLAVHNLAVDDGVHWRAVPFSAEGLDAIARDCGTAGRHEAQARRHEQERRGNVMRQIHVIAGRRTDPREWEFIEDGLLVNLHTGELPDVYGQFWPIRLQRPGPLAAATSAARGVGRKLARTLFADPLSTLVGYVETNLRYRASAPSGVPRGVATPRSTPSLGARARYGMNAARRRIRAPRWHGLTPFYSSQDEHRCERATRNDGHE